MSDTDFPTQEAAIDNADIIIVGNSTTKSIMPLMISFSASAEYKVGTLIFPDMPEGDTENSHEGIMRIQTIPDAEFAYHALSYAKNHGKKTIFISLLAPYDLPIYQYVSDAMLAGYNHYGYLNTFYRGPSMPALTQIIFGITQPKAKLPINVPDPLNPQEIIYPRGYSAGTSD